MGRGHCVLRRVSRRGGSGGEGWGFDKCGRGAEGGMEDRDARG